MTEAPLRLAEEQLCPDFAYSVCDEDCEDRIVLMFYMEEAA